jgi:hypothetical protein
MYDQGEYVSLPNVNRISFASQAIFIFSNYDIKHLGNALYFDCIGAHQNIDPKGV